MFCLVQARISITQWQWTCQELYDSCKWLLSCFTSSECFIGSASIAYCLFSPSSSFIPPSSSLFLLSSHCFILLLLPKSLVRFVWLPSHFPLPIPFSSSILSYLLLSLSMMFPLFHYLFPIFPAPPLSLRLHLSFLLVIGFCVTIRGGHTNLAALLSQSVNELEAHQWVSIRTLLYLNGQSMHAVLLWDKMWVRT